MKHAYTHIKQTVYSSFGQLYFADNKVFSLLLLLASFVDWQVGLSGFFSVLFAFLICRWLELDKELIQNGTLTFNVLLTGLALGANFQFNAYFILLLFIGSLLSLLLSVGFNNFFSKNKLPFLSLPFVLSVWILFLNARVYPSSLFIEKNSFDFTNPIWQFNHNFSTYLEAHVFPTIVSLYFKSMSSVLFQTGLLPGLLITLGLLIHSRIAFVLSWIGFVCGYAYFMYTHPMAQANDYLTVAFNYLFSAIAIGGFFIIPSRASFLLVILSTPLIGLINTAFAAILEPYYLSVFSLPYSLAVILIVSLLNNRTNYKHLKLTVYQFYSPEINLYVQQSHLERFNKTSFLHIHLPFYGEWQVSQGYNGSLTHRDEWQYALDFVVVDKENKTFKQPGTSVNDYYCFGLPVLAPADGEVSFIEDGISDNAIGENNLHQNWGNTIIIKHADLLYSKLSHLKKDSLKVNVGDRVRRGDIIALCGSSGRSPEPHLHFQLQSTNFKDGKTLNYPISYYLSVNNQSTELQAFSVPKEKEIVARPPSEQELVHAFQFLPGMKLRYKVDQFTNIEEWEVNTNSFNQSYIACHKTKSRAFFNYNTTLFYFTDFVGDTHSHLYHFYLAAFKVSLGLQNGLVVKDKLPIHFIKPRHLKLLQDFFAPFTIFLNPSYESENKVSSTSQQVTIFSTVTWFKGSPKKGHRYEISVTHQALYQLKIECDQTCQVLNFIH